MALENDDRLPTERRLRLAMTSASGARGTKVAIEILGMILFTPHPSSRKSS